MTLTLLLLLRRRFYLEVVARRRFRILSSWEQDGYRMAQPRFFHDDVPTPGSPEAARTAELALSLAALADAWVDRVKCGPQPLCPLHSVHRAASLGIWNRPACCHHPCDPKVSPIRCSCIVDDLGAPLTDRSQRA